MKTEHFPGSIFAIVSLALLLGPCNSGKASALSLEAVTNFYVVDLGLRHQTMDNFGANDAWSMQKVGAWSEANKNHIADLLFATNTGIGLSCWRFNLGAGINTNTIRNPWRTVETFAVAEGKYDWNRQANERWFLRAAKAHGVRQFLATVYSPPRWLTRNGLSNLGADTHSTTNLKPGAEDQFAAYITDILVHFRDNPDERERIEFDYVLPFNEPQWDWQYGQEGNRAGNADLKRTWLALVKRLKQTGLKTKILGPESGNIPDMYLLDPGPREKWRADYGNYLHLICDDPEVSDGFVGILSYHSYWSDRVPDQLVPHRRELGRALSHYPAWKIWQTEYCIMESGRDLTMDSALRMARIVHCDLTLVSASAWLWWNAIANDDYKSGLIYTDYHDPGDAETVCESKLLWALGNYSRFIRPGMWRVEMAGRQDVVGLMASMFLGPEPGRAVIVFVNLAGHLQKVSLTMKGAEAGTITDRLFVPYVTSAETNLAAGRPVDIAKGFDIPARSVVTMVGEIGGNFSNQVEREGIDARPIKAPM